MKTMKDRIAQLDRDHRNSLIALAAHAEGADDLNAIVDGLGKFSVHLHGAYPPQFDIVDTCARIEKSITQWPEYDTGKIREDVWKMPLMWGSNFGKVFKKDDNTIILYDDIAGKYIECKRAVKEA